MRSEVGLKFRSNDSAANPDFSTGFEGLLILDCGTMRAAYKPKEFADLFGRSESWAYRQIYAKKVKVLSGGRLLIPKSEVNRFLKEAGEYTPKRRASKRPFQARNGWREIVRARKTGGIGKRIGRRKAGSAAAIMRLAKKKRIN